MSDKGSKKSPRSSLASSGSDKSEKKKTIRFSFESDSDDSSEDNGQKSIKNNSTFEKK